MTPTSQERNSQGPETSGDDRADTETTALQPRRRNAALRRHLSRLRRADEAQRRTQGAGRLLRRRRSRQQGNAERRHGCGRPRQRAGLHHLLQRRRRAQRERLSRRRHGAWAEWAAAAIPAAEAVGPAAAAAVRHPGGTTRAPASTAERSCSRSPRAPAANFFEAKKKDNLEDIYGLIAGALRQQYLLTYTPDKVDTEGDFHKIVLKTNNSDLTVITREGYYAPTSRQVRHTHSTISQRLSHVYHLGPLCFCA